MQISVWDQEDCRIENGYATQYNNYQKNNVTNCCNVGLNKFKFFPNQSCRGAPQGATIQLQGASQPRSIPGTYQNMVWGNPPVTYWVYKLTNLQLQPATANNAVICLQLSGPCPTMEVRLCVRTELFYAFIITNNNLNVLTMDSMFFTVFCV